MEYEVFKVALLKALEERLDGNIGLEYGMVQRNKKSPCQEKILDTPLLVL